MPCCNSAAADAGVTTSLPDAAPDPSVTARVFRAVAQRGTRRAVVADARTFADTPIGNRIAEQVAEGRKLEFILPAFPFKSSNREKTHGPAPDLGDYLALKSLDDMCAEINAAYAPGSIVHICSDGRVFNDIMFISDEDLMTYFEGVRAIIRERGLQNLDTYSLDDYVDRLRDSDLRRGLVHEFGPTLDEVRDQILKDDSRRLMCLGIMRFVRDDVDFHCPDISRKKRQRKARAIAYQILQRSQSWDNLLATAFPDALRLSIHPYYLGHSKYSVQMVQSARGDSWATPWHNVLVKGWAKNPVLMKRREALALGAVAVHEDLVFYQLPSNAAATAASTRDVMLVDAGLEVHKQCTLAVAANADHVVGDHAAGIHPPEVERVRDPHPANQR